MTDKRAAAFTSGRLFGWLGKSKPLVMVVPLSGVIGQVGPLRSGLRLSSVASQLERAFAVKRARAVALVVNSPGGSPVQSRLIFARIRALAEEHGKPVFVFAEDVAASGGYMLALAGDEIYADPSSVVGSIGVITATFGFDKAIARLGVERRIYTAGNSKALLDPFLPERQEDVGRLKAVQEDVHALFKQMVRERRGLRLKGDDDSLFNGAFWSGRQAVELGLVDGIGDLRSVMREKYGEDVRLKMVPQQRGLLRGRLPFFAAPKAGAPLEPGLVAGLADELVCAVEARALWSRFGL